MDDLALDTNLKTKENHQTYFSCCCYAIFVCNKICNVPHLETIFSFNHIQVCKNLIASIE